MKEIKRYFAYMGKDAYMYWAILIITLVVESALQLLYSYINKQTLNAVEYGNMEPFRNAIVLCVIVVILKCLFPYLRYFEIRLVRKMVFELKISLFHKLLKLRLSYYEKSHSAEGLKTLNWDANSLKDSWFSHVYWVLGKVTLGASALIAMLMYSPILTVISVVICALTVWISVWLNNEMKKSAKNVQKGMMRLAEKLSDILAGFSVLKMYSGASIVVNNFLDENKNVTDRELGRVKKASELEMLGFLLGIMGSFGTIIAGTYLAAQSKMDYGTIMAVVTLQMSLSNTMQRLGSSIAIFTNSLVKAGKVFDFMGLDCEEEVGGENGSVGSERVDFGGTAPIVVNNLTFSYDGGKKVFDNMCLQVGQSEKLVVMGESGCGKSTLLKLLLRFYDCDGGSIKIYGKNINDYSVRHIRDLITYIPQESYLFEGTIAENIAYGSSGTVTTAQIENAAKLAYADEFINQFKDKYNTQVRGGGQNLSGGQRQRIAIARAFLKNSPILLMDEPSSALDVHSEQMINKALNELMKDKVVIMITHRRSSVGEFDRVVTIP